MKAMLIAAMIALAGCSTTIETPRDPAPTTTVVQPAPVVERPATSVIVDP